MNQEEKYKIQITTRNPKNNTLFIVNSFDQIKHKLRFDSRVILPKSKGRFRRKQI